MTVQDLIDALQAVDDKSRIVIMQKDAEGNGYSPLACMGDAAYRAETTWYGEIGLEALTDELRACGYTEEDVLEGGRPALVLQPEN